MTERRVIKDVVTIDGVRYVPTKDARFIEATITGAVHVDTKGGHIAAIQLDDLTKTEDLWGLGFQVGDRVRITFVE